tara:strand:- start:173 stop:919 length:747 start_codon:yes stop_codon:yes gene_type:complete
MEYQNIFRKSYCDVLKSKVKDGSCINFYESDTFEYDKSQVLISPKIKINPDLKLLEPDENSKYDFENAKILYENYKELTPLEASDIRLWIYLSHVHFFQYVKKRWPNIKTAKNPGKYILEHWFIESPSQGNLIRHSLSGLWWNAYLTYDDTRKDPYELTKELYKQLDIATRTLTTYEAGRHKELVHGVLEFIIENPILFATARETKTRHITRYINIIGGTKPLGFFSKDYFKALIKQTKPEIEKVKSR